MKSLIAVIVITLALVGSALTQADSTVIQRAAVTVTRIHDKMLDPDSFVLDGVYTAAGNDIKCEGFGCRHKIKTPVTVLCFAFRSHNRMGGYSEGRAYLYPHAKGDDFRIFSEVSNGEFQGYDEGWGAPCGAKQITAEITTEVRAALAPPAVSSAEQAKRAQRYADCLKLAVDNPNIVCEQ
ncbi:MAG: hypothetical protein ACLQBK_02855 [Candidatus Sulfotelmatobacter sp.]